MEVETLKGGADPGCLIPTEVFPLLLQPLDQTFEHQDRIRHFFFKVMLILPVRHAVDRRWIADRVGSVSAVLLRTLSEDVDEIRFDVPRCSLDPGIVETNHSGVERPHLLDPAVQLSDADLNTVKRERPLHVIRVWTLRAASCGYLNLLRSRLLGRPRFYQAAAPPEVGLGVRSPNLRISLVSGLLHPPRPGLRGHSVSRAYAAYGRSSHGV
jgi:hypothetical protein